jgi:hypothetical protein
MFIGSFLLFNGYLKSTLEVDVPLFGLTRVRQAIVDAVLTNNSLLSIKLDIHDDGKNILTPEDEAVIQQHIDNHKNTVRNDINSIAWRPIAWQCSLEDDKKEYMLPGISDLIFQYVVPQ